MCRSCAQFAASSRSRQRCTDPASNAGASRSNHAVKIIKRSIPAVPVPEPLPASASTDASRLLQLIGDALAMEESAQGAAALAELRKTYGSLDLAVAAAGAAVQARAEEIAGITVGEIKAGHDRRAAESLERYEAAKSAHAAAARNFGPAAALLEKLNDAMDTHRAAKAGTDPETAEEMRRLIEGRLAALSERQEMGGEHAFAPGSDPVTVEALGGGSKCYPSAWLAISSSGRKIMAIGSDGESGHYNPALQIDRTFHELDSYESFTAETLPVDAEPDPWNGNLVLTGEKNAAGQELYAREIWHVATDYTDRDADGKPTSDDPWEEWAHPVTGEVSWRHPWMKTERVGSKEFSDLTVGPRNPANVAGMGALHSIAVHEQAHRFEGVINNVEALEDMFLTRRTTLPDGTLEAPQAYTDTIYVRPDHFSEKYTGRRYKQGGSELFSTGMEAVFAGQYGGFIGIGGRLPDAELQNFVLGLLVTCGGKRRDC